MKWWSREAGSSATSFDRFVGLETEYAIRFRPNDPSAARPSDYRIYQWVIRELARHVLTVKAHHLKEGVFIANGGAIWFERIRYTGDIGLIEGATPECRSPWQVLTYQRALDQLLYQATCSVPLDGHLTLIKNDRDSQGNVYGAQENYEVLVARGWRLVCWRLGLALLLPLMLFSWAGLLLQVCLLLAYLIVGALVYWLLRPLLKTGQRRRLVKALFGEDLANDRHEAVPLAGWMESIQVWITVCLVSPLAVCLLLLVRGTAFRRIQRQLTPFLISRAVLAGSGMLHPNGEFHLADKADAVNCLVGFCGLWKDRPIFSIGHLFKSVCVQAWHSPVEYVRLFAARQRLQIALGDSNMSQESEYLRIATTMMVIEAIENGQLTGCPRLRRPIRALKQICQDASLATGVPVAGRGRWTALQLQRWYLEACRNYLNQLREVPAEAQEVLERWEGVLDDLQDHREGLVGRIDWITKKYLLDEAGRSGDWAARKKIDLRYHELSPQGYYWRVKSTGIAPSWIAADDLERTIRNPPPGTPATTRARYIREFSEGPVPLRVNWNDIILGRGFKRKVIRLAAFGRNKPSRREANVPEPD